MKNNEFDEVPGPLIIKTGDTRWCGIETVIQQSEGDQRCFYCNFSLECGQKECIWHEGCADSTQITL